MDTKHLIPIIDFAEKIMTSGSGTFLYDGSGNRYIDLNSGQFCTVLGHSNKEFQARVFSQMGEIVHTASDIVSEPVLLCAEKMNRISGKMNARIISLSTGSEAVEFALRYGKHISGKDGVVCFEKGYHGLSLGSQSITYGGRFSRPHIEQVYPVPIPPNAADEDTIRTHLDMVESVVSAHRDEVALVVMEPVVSVGGMFYPPAEYFRGIRQICDDYGILLVFDESQTGFGRIGSWFAFQLFDVIPDMVVLSKGVGMGFPVSFVLMEESIIPDQGFKMSHYSSHQNDAFAGIITGAAIDYIEEHNILEKVKRTGEYYLARLEKLAASNSHFINPRGRGLMLGAEFYFEGVNDYRRIYHELRDELMNKGVIIQGTNGGRTFRSLPDYLITEDVINSAIEILDDVLNQRDWSSYE